MSGLLPFDLTEIVYEELLRDRREPDGLLHASSHIVSSLRHAQLDVAGAPQKAPDLMGQIRMMTGTLWHKWLSQRLEGLPVMREVNLTPWLPDGWGGTADFVVWNPELQAFVLIDLKTTKGEGIRWVRDGAKDEHIAQTSAYWYALKKMGLPIARKIGVYYLPMNDVRTGTVEPVLVDFEPIRANDLLDTMEDRAIFADRYVRSIDPDGPANPGRFLTDELAGVQERIQKVRLDKKTGTYELWLEPHWSTMFCPYEHELCDCSTQEKELVGIFDGPDYHPRPGFEDVTPLSTP